MPVPDSDVAPAPRPRDAQATRARILRAASQEFARLGFAGARGERIAQRARSSERMLYYYYGSKEGLYRAVLEAAYLGLRQAERTLELDALAPAAALAHFCRFVWRFYAEHPEFIGLVNAENLAQARHLRRSGQLAELALPVVEQLRALLARGRAAGVFRAGIDPVELYIAVASLGYFYLSNAHTLSAVLGRNLKDPPQIESHWTASEDMILRFVSAR